MLLVAVLAVVAGIIAHTGIFIRGEWHTKGHKIIAAHLLLGAGTYLLFKNTDELRTHPGYHLGIAAAWYFGALFTSMTVYRLYFHATVSFPGPRLAAVTKFWHVLQIADSRNHIFLQKMHKKYGTLVRTGPNEITIFHPAGIQLLDGWDNENTKDPWYDLLQPATSVVFTRDEHEHKERRKTWVQALATKSMDSLRPRLAEQAHTLSRCIAKYAGKPLDIDDVMTWFSFDVMGDVVFGQDFDLMNSCVTLPAIRHRDRALAMLGPINDTTWLAHLGFTLVPFYGKVQDWFRFAAFCNERMKLRMDTKNPGKVDMASWFIDEYNSLEAERSLKSRQSLLTGTVMSAVVAGSDTTRAGLIATWWHLCKYPEHTDKIRAELRGVDIDDANALARLPHLNGVINEVLRLAPPTMTGTGRITGPNGLLVDGTLIPPYTKVTAPKYVIQRLEAAFQHPNEFIPERWYSRPELILDKRAFAPFSLANRQCVGKALAYAELRLSTAILLQNYNVKFAPDYDPESMWKLMKDQVTAQPGPVVCIFERRDEAI